MRRDIPTNFKTPKPQNPTICEVIFMNKVKFKTNHFGSIDTPPERNDHRFHRTVQVRPLHNLHSFPLVESDFAQFFTSSQLGIALPRFSIF